MKERINMNLILLVLIFVVIALFAIFSGRKSSDSNVITMAEAKTIFQQDGDYVILDVRRPDEYAQGHIPYAVNYANEAIASA